MSALLLPSLQKPNVRTASVLNQRTLTRAVFRGSVGRVSKGGKSKRPDISIDVTLNVHSFHLVSYDFQALLKVLFSIIVLFCRTVFYDWENCNCHTKQRYSNVHLGR